MVEFILGIIIGVITTLIGFFLSLLWENFKLKKEKEAKRNQFFQIVKEELLENKKLLISNINVLKIEVPILNHKKTLVWCLSPLKNSFWDLFKSNFDLDYLSNNNLKKLRNINLNIIGLNSTIISRESHKINNGAMSNYYNTFKLYDQRLIDDSESLLKNINTLNL